MAIKGRKLLISLLLILSLALGMCSCSEARTVSFVFGNGDPDQMREFPPFERVRAPYVPQREGYIFTGWYLDEEATVKYNFSIDVAQNTILYAGWSPDYEYMVNNLAERVMTSVVRIEAKCFKPGIASSGYYEDIQGSGVICMKSGAELFAVTNYHVALGNDSYSGYKYTVYDCFGESYDGYLQEADESKDLAVIRFYSGSEKLTAATLTDQIPDKNEAVAAIGHPGGQINSVTLGKIKDYEMIKVDEGKKDGSEVDIPVLWHTAPADHGSSGGGLFNVKGELLGINFATGLDEDGEFAMTLSIPTSYVKEILERAVK